MIQTSEGLAGRFGLGSIDQISFAVADLDEAIPRYSALFGGEFEVIEAKMSDIFVRGRPASVHIRLGFGKSGTLEIEVVQVVAGEYPIKDFLAEHGEGFHHVRFPVSDLKATKATREAEGYNVTLEGESGATLFAYLESPDLAGGTIELIQFPPS